MAERSLRRTAYGAPVPELAEASKRVVKDTPANVEQRRRIHALLDEVYQALLRHDVYADVTLCFHVVRGVIQADVSTGIVRSHGRRE
jgi:hypothetical protein